MPLKQLVKMILEESGYIESWRQDPSPDAPGRVENLQELIATMEDFDHVWAFLEHIALVMENHRQSDEGGTMIMTIHNAKGLEFDAVFLPGMEEGLFPHQRAMEDEVHGIEEERRLAYVAMTRARRYLFLSCAQQRYLYDRTVDCIASRFIGELDRQHIDIQGLHDEMPPDALHANPHMGERVPASYPRREQGASRAKNRRGLRGGERVRHEEFGSGIVVEVKNDRASVVFNQGIKTVIADYLEKIPTSDEPTLRDGYGASDEHNI